MCIVVERHGGNSNHRWRPVWRCLRQDSADRVYERYAARMRQGAVRMYRINDDGTRTILRDVWAPRLRTRW